MEEQLLNKKDVGTLFALSYWRASRIAFGVDKTIATHTKGHIETLQT